MITPRFRLTMSDGSTVTGVIQGSGGFVKTLARLLGGIDRAKRGLDSGFYEPLPGHVAVFSSFSASSDGPARWIDMRRIVKVEEASQ